MSALSDLAFRLFGHSLGTWFWVPNDQTLHAITERRWSEKEGSHPFVLVFDYDGGPSATVRPRSTTSDRGLDHLAHPADCAVSCKIDRRGWILRVLWSLRADALSADHYSCVEPYEDIVTALKDGR